MRLPILLHPTLPLRHALRNLLMLLAIVVGGVIATPALNAADAFNQEYNTAGNQSSVTDAVNETGKAGNSYLQLGFRLGVGAVVLVLLIVGGMRLKDGNMTAAVWPFIAIGVMILVLALAEKYLLKTGGTTAFLDHRGERTTLLAGTPRLQTGIA